MSLFVCWIYTDCLVTSSVRAQAGKLNTNLKWCVFRARGRSLLSCLEGTQRTRFARSIWNGQCSILLQRTRSILWVFGNNPMFCLWVPVAVYSYCNKLWSNTTQANTIEMGRNKPSISCFLPKLSSLEIPDFFLFFFFLVFFAILPVCSRTFSLTANWMHFCKNSWVFKIHAVLYRQEFRYYTGKSAQIYELFWILFVL